MPKSKTKTVFVCERCGAEYLAWQGRCDLCQEWNTLKSVPGLDLRTWAQTGEATGQVPTTTPLSEAPATPEQRLVTGLDEFDRVLGGGLVRGSLVLVSGDPGVGKSTLLLQAAAALAQKGETVVYVSGEESQAQIRSRAERLQVLASQILVTTATDVTALLALAQRTPPAVMIVDSIQTLFHPEFPSSPGSVVQLRETAVTLQRLAKKLNVAVILVGHITKQGTIAGPKLLEHVVDVVLSFDARTDHSYRLLRVEKNRFGDADEVGVLAMSQAGFTSVADPSQYFLAERQVAPGSVLTVVLEGRRPLILEVQALAHKTNFGYPKRAASGFDLNRLQLLLAILERHAAVPTGEYDVFINIVGGLRVREPAADLAVAAAIVSSVKNIALPDKLCLFGEVGLTGEVRQVTAQARRAETVKRLGYQTPPFERSLLTVLRKLFVAKESIKTAPPRDEHGEAGRSLGD